MFRTEVQALVRELRSCKLHSAARKKKRKKENLFISGRGNNKFKGPEEAVACRAMRPVLGVW